MAALQLKHTKELKSRIVTEVALKVQAQVLKGEADRRARSIITDNLRDYAAPGRILAQSIRVVILLRLQPHLVRGCFGNGVNDSPKIG